MVWFTLIVIVRKRAQYRRIFSRRSRRPSRLKSGVIVRPLVFIFPFCLIVYAFFPQRYEIAGSNHFHFPFKMLDIRHVDIGISRALWPYLGSVNVFQCVKSLGRALQSTVKLTQD